eukprot:1354474-Amorphochlora_amoeboformis.AAC.1
MTANTTMPETIMMYAEVFNGSIPSLSTPSQQSSHVELGTTECHSGYSNTSSSRFVIPRYRRGSQ